MLFKKKCRAEAEDCAVKNEDKMPEEDVKAEQSEQSEQPEQEEPAEQAEQKEEPKQEMSEDKASFMEEKLLYAAEKGLEDAGLDKAFAPLLTADTEGATLENIKEFKALFMAKLEQEIVKRLKGSAPKTGKELNEDYDPFLSGFNM